MSEDGSIKVSVRIRPLNQRELGENQTMGFEYNNTSLLEKTTTGQKVYRFDHCFGPKSTNEEAYTSVGKSLVMHALDGYNATIFTYGQTGSGKTHSILGNDSDPGFIPRCIDDVFNYVESKKETTDFTIMVSYLEVYNEDINDLLQVGEEGKNLRIKTDDPQKGAIIDGLVEQVVSNKKEIQNVLKLGENQRSYGSTKMNNTSSRSHTLFRMVIESRTELVLEDEEDQNLTTSPSQSFTKFGSSGPKAGESKKISYLNLVDLAGSERQKSTGATGSQLKEGSNINKSLLALGAVISKLGESARKSGKSSKATFIPFRDSKLTRILKNSLGGNTLTSILCTVTAAPMHHEETVSTLKFGQLCKTIKNNAKKNEVVDEKTLLKQYRSKISELTHQLAVERGEDTTDSSGSGNRSHRNSMQGGVNAEAKLREALEHSDELQQKLDKLSDFFMKRGSGSNPLPVSPSGTEARLRSRTRSASAYNIRVDSISEEFADAVQDSSASMIPTKQGEVGGEATFRDMAQLKASHDDEISQMHAHIEELESLLEIETDSNRKMRDDINMKDEYINDLYRHNEELLEAENEKQEFQENARREIQEYHDLRQGDLDKLQEQISHKKETVDVQEETLGKRRQKLEEIEVLLSTKLAFLDEKESELQNQLNKLTQNIRIWDVEKDALGQKEGEILDWSKTYAHKEWELEQKEKVIEDAETELQKTDKELKRVETDLNDKSKKLTNERAQLEHVKQILAKKESTIEADWDDLTKWKKLLKEREIEVEEKERNCKKKEEDLKQATKNMDKREQVLNKKQLEISGKNEDLIMRESQVTKDQATIKMLKPALESRSREFDYKHKSLEDEKKKLEAMSTLNKELKEENEEKQIEINIKTKHLEEREQAVAEKEKLHKHLDELKLELRNRELKQKMREDEWTDTAGRANAKHADMLKQTEELLTAQIATARTYEAELESCKSDLDKERKQRNTTTEKFQQLQSKYEALLEERTNSMAWGGGGEGGGGGGGGRKGGRTRTLTGTSVRFGGTRELKGRKANEGFTMGGPENVESVRILRKATLSTEVIHVEENEEKKEPETRASIGEGPIVRDHAVVEEIGLKEMLIMSLETSASVLGKIIDHEEDPDQFFTKSASFGRGYGGEKVRRGGGGERTPKATTRVMNSSAKKTNSPGKRGARGGVRTPQEKQQQQKKLQDSEGRQHKRQQQKVERQPTMTESRRRFAGRQITDNEKKLVRMTSKNVPVLTLDLTDM